MPAEPFIYRLPVRYADTDAQGHVFFANYLVYCDEALTYFFEHIGLSYNRLEAEHGVQLVYASSGCDYRERTLFGDPLQVKVEVERIGRTSLTTRYQIERMPGRLAATGRLVSVCLDAETREPRPLPEPLRTALTPLA